MNKKNLLFLLCFQIIVGSCSTGNLTTEALFPVTDTVTPILETSEALLNESTCLDFSETVPESLAFPGKLIIYKQHERFLLNLTNKTYLPLVGEISPDGKKIATYVYGKGIQITDNSNHMLMTIPWNPRWTEANKILFGDLAEYDRLFYGWRDNDEIGIPALPVGSLFLLNTVTSEAREITFPYSNEVWSLGGSADIRDNYVSFSPDFDKVVYASTMSHLVLRNNSVYSDGKWRTVIWVGFSFAYSNPSWSPDGSRFVFVIETRGNIKNLFQVDADFAVGERQLTDLNSLFNNPYQVSITQISWSPNGKKIAFVAHLTHNEGDEPLPRLLVLDVDTNDLEDYCNPDPNTPYTSNGFSYVWSPDGKYIATDTTIVDLDSRRAYKVPDVYILDWVGEGRTR